LLPVAAQRPSTAQSAPDASQTIELPGGTVQRFYVTHLHGGGFAGRCYGHIDIGQDDVAYVPVPTQADHAFAFPRGQVNATASRLSYPEVHLKTPSGTQKFIVVDRDMVERVRSTLATRAHTKDPKTLASALSGQLPAAGEIVAGPSSDPRRASAAGANTPGPQRRWDQRFTEPLGSIYRLEEELDFNVLDGAYFDAASGQVTLYGHQDARYEGPQIPYLQHLAALLENPRPEITLEWTPESERRVNAFLERKETRADAQRAAHEMAQFLDANGKVNNIGRLLFPGWGVKPTRNGASRAGYLGVEVVQHAGPYVRVTRVQPGSPAAHAGIRVGDVITYTSYGAPLTPREFSRNLLYSGEGYQMNIGVNDRPAQLITLGAASGDPWHYVDKEELLAAILRAAGMGSQAWVLDGVYLLGRVENTPGADVSFAMLTDRMQLTPQGLELKARHGDTPAFRLAISRLANARFEEVFGSPRGTFSAPFEEAYRRTGSPDQAYKVIPEVIQRETRRLVEDATNRLFARKEGILIAPELVDRTWAVRPAVQPKFMGVRPDTQLARAMVVGDYLGKQLVNMPTLKATLPRYQTQYEFLQRNPQFDRKRAEYRMWISVGRFAAAQSPDRSTFAIRDIAMQFNIREIGAAGRNLPPEPGDYQELLTSLYDDLARQFFVLHELREAAKVAGVAEWIRARAPGYRLPASGQSPWRAPATLPGLMFMYVGGWTAGSTTAPVTTFATGGVAVSPYRQWGAFFDGMAPVDSSIVDLRRLPLTSGKGPSALTPPSYTNTEYSRIMRHTIDVPPPPPPDGWVGQARNGEQTLRLVSVLRTRASETDSVEAYDKLAELEMLGRQMAKLDEMINAINARSPELQKASADTIAGLEADEAKFKQQCLALIRQSMFNLRSELKPGTIAQTAEGVAQFKDLAEKIDGYRSRLDALTSKSSRRQIEELTEIAGELREALSEYESSPLLGPVLKTLQTASKMEKVVALGTGFLKLFAISDYNVEKLYNDQDTRFRVLNSLTAYKDKLQRRIEPLRNDPALTALGSRAR
jgi:hypothetical protein